MSLTGMYDKNNIFAKILRGDMPCVKVYEDELVLAFMDVFPQSPGHTLVIPKTSSRTLFDASAETLGPLIETTQKIAQAVVDGLSPDGVIITQFNGAPAGQTVFHLHFHIIPKYTAVQTAPHAAGQMADTDLLAKHAALISAHIKSN